MAHLLIRSKVEDYNKWKPMFDEHAAFRKNHGSKGARLFRSAANPNEIAILFDWDDVKNARQFGQSPELREIMQRAGVIGQPDVQFLEEIGRTDT